MTLKMVNLNKKTVEPGTKIRVENEKKLISEGYARRLTKDETHAILDEYVTYAEKVFSEKPVVITQKKAKKQVKKTYETGALF